MLSLFTCCHRIVTVLCLVCLFVAVVDGMQGSLTYQLRTPSHQSLSIQSCPSCSVDKAIPSKKGGSRAEYYHCHHLSRSLTLAGGKHLHLTKTDKKTLSLMAYKSLRCCASSKNVISKATPMWRFFEAL